MSAIVDILDNVMAKYLTSTQYDRHVYEYRIILYAYGSVAVFNKRMFEMKMRQEFKRRVENETA